MSATETQAEARRTKINAARKHAGLAELAAHHAADCEGSWAPCDGGLVCKLCGAATPIEPERTEATIEKMLGRCPVRNM